jgi:hypothetical protein
MRDPGEGIETLGADGEESCRATCFQAFSPPPPPPPITLPLSLSIFLARSISRLHFKRIRDEN